MHYPTIFLTVLLVTVLSFPARAKNRNLDARIEHLHDVIEDKRRHNKLTEDDSRILSDEVYNLEKLSRIYHGNNHLEKMKRKTLKRRVKEIKLHIRKLVKHRKNERYIPPVLNNRVLPGYGVVPDLYLPNY